VKRKNNTIFLHVEPSDSFATLKEKCGEVYGVSSSNVGLFTTEKVSPDATSPLLVTRTVHHTKLTGRSRLPVCVGIATSRQVELMDLATVGDREIPNDGVIWLCLKKDGEATQQRAEHSWARRSQLTYDRAVLSQGATPTSRSTLTCSALRELTPGAACFDGHRRGA